VFTARYALSPYIKQIRFVFKGLILFLILIKQRNEFPKVNIPTKLFLVLNKNAPTCFGGSKHVGAFF
jgi:hypothetical protein